MNLRGELLLIELNQLLGEMRETPFKHAPHFQADSVGLHVISSFLIRFHKLTESTLSQMTGLHCEEEPNRKWRPATFPVSLCLLVFNLVGLHHPDSLTVEGTIALLFGADRRCGGEQQPVKVSDH